MKNINSCILFSKNPFQGFAYLFVLILLFNSCSNTKYLAEGESLYLGSTVEIKSDNKIPSGLAGELEGIIRPQPNKKFLGIGRFKLWVYNQVDTVEKQKGFKYWLKYKLGEPPVLFKENDIDNNKKILSGKLKNKGFFTPEISAEAKQKKKKKTTVTYTVEVDQQYHINQITYFITDKAIERIFLDAREDALIKEGDAYDLDKLIAERARVESILKNKGYYYFRDDYILYQIDSSSADSNNLVNIFVRIKEEVPEKDLQIYQIGDISVTINETILEDTNEIKNIRQVGQYTYKTDDEFPVKPTFLNDHIFLKEDSIYRKENFNATLNRMSALGVFSYINIDFKDIGDQTLDADITLAMLKKRSLRAELELVSKSNGFTGPGLSLSLLNRNFLKGAELLNINFFGGFESQIGGSQTSGFATFEYGVNVSLDMPGIRPSLGVLNPDKDYLPKTTIEFGYTLQNRVRFYQLNSLSGSYSFRFNSSAKIDHKIKTLYLSYLKLSNTSDEFQALINENPILKTSFEEQFLIGHGYTFNFNNFVDPDRKNNIAYTFDLDLSGNSAYLIQSLIQGKPDNDTLPYELFGRPYAQFARVSSNFRYYFNFKNSHTIATRLYAGIGLPYLNSSTLPYTKQFFVGGPNSLRGFTIRSVGPGSYNGQDDTMSSQFLFLDQTGNTKLETNVEYRFPIVAILKGALFVDAGNVWLTYDDPKKPGGKFDPQKFISELAVSAGFGIRIDPQFFVIRLDIGFPIRKPYLPEAERWIINDIDIASKEWRRDNLVLNIAIGYPF